MACVLAVGMTAKAAAEDAGQRITVEPQDNGQALVNPGMGWTLHFYSNVIENYGSKLEPSDTLDDWPGLSAIYLRVPWSFLEPEEGKFNWSLFDTPTQRWVAKGKKIAIRVSCSESWCRYGTPKWVHDAGAKGVDFEFGKGPARVVPCGIRTTLIRSFWPSWIISSPRWPGVTTAIRTSRSSTSARSACGAKGTPGFSSRLNEAQTLAVVKRHIDLHVKHFPRTLLCISDDVAGPSKPGRHFPETDYAISKGVTLRDDRILVQPPPHSWYHAQMAEAFWPRCR